MSTVPLGPCDRVLEIGCGAGFAATYLRGRYSSYTGIDPSTGLVGLAHGLAGSAAIALLALAAMPTTSAALVYLLIFGIGTLTGMVGFSAALGVPLAAVGRNPRAGRLVCVGTGLVSIALGCLIVFEFGLRGGPVGVG